VSKPRIGRLHQVVQPREERRAKRRKAKEQEVTNDAGGEKKKREGSGKSLFWETSRPSHGKKEKRERRGGEEKHWGEKKHGEREKTEGRREKNPLFIVKAVVTGQDFTGEKRTRTEDSKD